jgi:serine/threonine-protein kinase
MALTIGTQLGSHEITALLGKGGMGEVYRARDLKLKREVAIKILPEEFARDADRVSRFQREAELLASLNHPNIAAIYDVEEASNSRFLVLELVEGDTLADRIKHGAIPIEEALPIAKQIAGALGEAHQKGIIHRDLKPANVKVTPDGRVKVLDFGLAKACERNQANAALSSSPTLLSVAATNAGLILGTAAYVSPEQAEGKKLDIRSDIFSFGTVLYEMFSGRRAFGGDTIVQVLTAVLRDDPPPLTLSAALDGIIRRCLAKQPGARFQTMSDVGTALARVPPAAPAVEAPSIAVLPFASMSPDPDNEYFSDGISEEIINALSQIGGLHVAARTSSFSFKGKSMEVGDIARRLNVRHVLEGSVRKAGSRLRVTAQLVDAANGYQLWSERYDREMVDVFDVQDEIARAIVRRLQVALAPQAEVRLVRPTTHNMEAYQQYLKGRAMLYRRGPWIARALESFQTAVVLDPDYAQAWAGVADAYTVLCYSGYRRPDQIMPAAVTAAKRAILADAGSAEAHNAAATVALLWERDFEKAEREFLEALRLSPEYMQARCWYGLFFLQWEVGRLDEGLAELQRAHKADPLSGYATMVLSFGLAAVQRFQEAVARARTAIEQDPESFVVQWELGMAYHWNQQYEDAIAVFEPLWADTGQSWLPIGLAPAYVKCGRIGEARAIYDALVARRSHEYVPPFVLALCLSVLGDHESAIAACEDAIACRDMLFALFHRWLPDFESVRADERFPGIVERFNASRRE